MSEELDHIDYVFRQKLEGFEKEPPAFVWDNIQGALQAEKKKRRIGFFWIVAGMLGLGGAFLAGYYVFRGTESEAQQAFVYDVRKVDSGKDERAASYSQFGTAATGHMDVSADAGLQIAGNRTANIRTEENTSPAEKNQAVSGANGRGNNLAVVNEPFANGNAQTAGKNNSGVNGSFTNPKGTQPAGKTQENSEPSGWDLPHMKLNNPELVRRSAERASFIVPEIRYQVLRADAYRNSDIAAWNRPKPAGTSRFFVSAFYGPQFTLTNSAIRDDSNNYQSYYGSNQDWVEQSRYGWNAGLDFGVRATRGLTFSVGINYSQFATYTDRNAVQAFLTSGGIPDSIQFLDLYSSMGSFDGIKINLYPGSSSGFPEYSIENLGQDSLRGLTQIFGSIEIPIHVAYRFGKRFGFTVKAGAAPTFIVRNEVQASLMSGTRTIGQTSDIRSFALNGSFGLGIDYEIIPNRFAIFLEPTARYSFTNWSSNSQVRFRPLNLSANIGLRAKF